jgi:hypothetical protein
MTTLIRVHLCASVAMLLIALCLPDFLLDGRTQMKTSQEPRNFLIRVHLCASVAILR